MGNHQPAIGRSRSSLPPWPAGRLEGSMPFRLPSNELNLIGSSVDVDRTLVLHAIAIAACVRPHMHCR
jgi:hypothetical protein